MLYAKARHSAASIPATLSTTPLLIGDKLCCISNCCIMQCHIVFRADQRCTFTYVEHVLVHGLGVEAYHLADPPLTQGSSVILTEPERSSFPIATRRFATPSRILHYPRRSSQYWGIGEGYQLPPECRLSNPGTWFKVMHHIHHIHS